MKNHIPKSEMPLAFNPSTLNPQPSTRHRDKRTLRVHIENISSTDADFLANVIALFTDPDQEDQAALVRAGLVTIQMDPLNGEPRFVTQAKPKTIAITHQCTAEFNRN